MNIRSWFNPLAACLIAMGIAIPAMPVQAAVYEKAGLIVPPATHVKLGDDSALRFGDGASRSDPGLYDVTARWDGTDLDWLPYANNTIMKWGNGTVSFDQWWYGSSASNYILFDASADLLNFKGGLDATFDSGTILTVAGTADITGTFKIGGTAVTSTAAEMNILTGLTASVTELNLSDGATEGVAVASKMLALGANKNVDTLVIADSGLKLGSGAGTAVTSTAAELNILDGVTASAADINRLDGLTPGTSSPSSAVVLDANSAINAMNVVTLSLGAGAGTAVTSSAAELNILDGVTAAAADLNRLDGLTPGTSSPSSAVVLDANSAINAMNIVTLSIGSGAGTAITASAAELNVLDNVGVVKEEITLLADPIASASFTIGTEAANIINVAVQLKNAQNANVSGIRFVTFYLSDSAAGAITGGVPNSTGSIGASGSIVVTDVAKGAFRVVTDANGACEFDFGETGNVSWYPTLVLPSGKIQQGAVIDFN